MRLSRQVGTLDGPRHFKKLHSWPNPVFRLATSIKMNTVFHTYRQNKEIILAKHFFPTKQAQNRLPAGSAILNVDRFNIMISRRRRQGARQSFKLHDSTGN